MKRLIVTVTEETVEEVATTKWREIRSWPPYPTDPEEKSYSAIERLPEYVKSALPRTDHAKAGETYGYVPTMAERKESAEVFRLELPEGCEPTVIAQAVLNAIPAK